LNVDWKGKNYVNPPFHGETIDGKRYAMTAWVRKAIEEQGKGKTSVLVFPQFGWFHALLICHTSMEGRNLTNVWNVSTGQTSESHRSIPLGPDRTPGCHELPAGNHSAGT
jgi:hypothetical protein